MGFKNDFIELRMSYIDELYDADPNKLDRIEGLLKTAAIQHELKEELYRELKGAIDTERAEELLEYLYANQVDPITGGNNYGYSDAQKKIWNEIINKNK